jgi:hypothetical protein
MLKNIRPWQVLFAVPEEKRQVQAFIPGRVSGVSTLELNVMLALLKLTEPARAFEFGTYFGDTTSQVALNLPASSHLWTLDLDKDSLPQVSFRLDPQSTPQENFEKFEPIRDWDVAHRVIGQARCFEQTPLASRITQLFGDSMAYDYSKLPGDFEFIFIDANHDYDYVRSDSLNALKMAKPGHSCLVWHDFGRPNDHPGVQRCLEEMAEDRDIYHVEETSLAVCLDGISILWPSS